MRKNTKEKYVSPECEVINFTSEDVITISSVGLGDTQDEYAEFDASGFTS